jgi:glycerol-3-phosphate acyltransferase PlsY
MTTVFALVPAAYLLGTFPSAELVARLRGVDVRAAGSGNPGASNVARLLGWKLGALVFLLDAGKGAAAAGVGLTLDGHRGAYILGIAAVLGHVFPVWRNFRGGRGVATGAGAAVVLFPLIFAVLAVVWLIITLGLHRASIASLVCVLAFPVLVLLTDHTTTDVVVIASVAVLVLLRHRANVARLIRGGEHRV